MEGEAGAAETAHMAKKPARVPKPPKFRLTFLGAWREFRDRTLEDMEEETGFAGSYLSLVENGHRPYNQKIVDAYSKALRVAPAALISRPPPEKDDEPSPDDTWDELTPDQRAAALNAYNALKTIR